VRLRQIYQFEGHNAASFALCYLMNITYSKLPVEDFIHSSHAEHRVVKTLSWWLEQKAASGTSIHTLVPLQRTT
jgi:hypothetical protein